MLVEYKLLDKISCEYGNSFYILDSKHFEKNYHDMLSAFRQYYSDTYIAYSYKTNYIPKLCEIIKNNNGFAEIVSEMEGWLAYKVGVAPEDIYYNGPYKKREYVEKCMFDGVHINLDSAYEIDIVSEVAKRNMNREFEVGIRCNMDIGQDEPSRFGFDIESGEFFKAVLKLNELQNLKVRGLHCHLPFRSLESFRKRIQVLQEILNKMKGYNWTYISLGGGYMGKVSEELSKQFSFPPPSYKEYAEIVAGKMAEIYGNGFLKPRLIIEPGSALVADTMQFVTRVIDIKHIEKKNIAILSGSIYNINPSTRGMKRPITIYRGSMSDNIYYESLDMGGYTCIESDYLYRGYQGELSVGDFVVFHNVGSYSLVMKPPFILPDVPVLELLDEKVLLIKQKQSEESIFADFYRK